MERSEATAFPLTKNKSSLYYLAMFFLFLIYARKVLVFADGFIEVFPTIEGTLGFFFTPILNDLFDDEKGFELAFDLAVPLFKECLKYSEES